VGKNKSQSAFFLRERHSYEETHTNTVTHESFVMRAHSTFHEIKATQVEGSVYEFTQLEVGQPFVVEDSSGRVVVRDRGSVRFHILFDTGGDSDPGGEFIDFLGADVRGPHPGFVTDADRCSYAADLTGGISTSSQRIALHPAGTTASPLGYAEYLPPDYDETGQSPLLVALHGFGESGDGSLEQLQNLAFNAIPKYVTYDGWPDDRPFVVLAPQHRIPDDMSQYDAACEGSDHFGSCAMMLQHTLGNPAGGSPCFTPDEVHEFITYAVANYGVDPHQVYLTGLSCGAFGGWEYLAEHGDEQVAAAVLIAGEGRPAWDTAGCALGDVPIWAFHGLADTEVDPQGSIVPIEQLQACGASDAELTLYPDADHDSWTRTYAVGSEVDIYSWMLSFTNP
jgi:poly(3-hydroxybutyrate) depolymerase